MTREQDARIAAMLAADKAKPGEPIHYPDITLGDPKVVDEAVEKQPPKPPRGRVFDDWRRR